MGKEFVRMMMVSPISVNMGVYESMRIYVWGVFRSLERGGCLGWPLWIQNTVTSRIKWWW